MSILLWSNNGINGFKIAKSNREAGKLDVILLEDGERFTVEKTITPEEEEDTIVEYLAMTMAKLDIERHESLEERKRIAKKMLELDYINGYYIASYERRDDGLLNVDVELLKNGKNPTNIRVAGIEDKKMNLLKERLNDCVSNNLDIKNQMYRFTLVDFIVETQRI